MGKETPFPRDSIKLPINPRMKTPQEVLNRFPSECCKEYITSNGVCLGCMTPIEETKKMKELDAQKQAYEYEEMWRKAFEVWDKAVDDLYGKN